MSISFTVMMNIHNQLAAKPTPLCIYCGKTPQKPERIEEDHVIPRSLFPDPKPNNSTLIKVPACSSCNRGLSKYQDMLRDWLVTDVRCSHHPAAQKLLTSAVKRSAGYGSSKVARAAKASAKLEPFRTNGGIYLGDVYTFPFDLTWVNYVFTMMAKGLYYATYERRLPDDYSVSVAGTDIGDPLAVRNQVQYYTSLGFNGPRHLGNDVCVFIWNRDATDPAATIWFLVFYDGIGIDLRTMPPGMTVDQFPTE